MRARFAVLALALLALLPMSGVAAAPAWEQWKSVQGVFDLGGPRADGSLVVAGSAALYTLTPAGDLTPFARGPGGYREDPSAEAYFALSPGQKVACAGPTQGITSVAPTLEGGIAVAPTNFGPFGGYLIAPDELSGVIWAISPQGNASKVVDSGLPKGGDIGVESVGFMPPGFGKGGYLYYSDRKTPGNPHPGTDSVLRMSSADLMVAGVEEGDMV